MTSPTPLPLHLLSLAIAAALACSTPSALAQRAGPVVADGTHEEPAPGDYSTSHDGAAGYVFHALNGGTLRATGAVAVSANGHDTSAVLAETNGTVAFQGGSITTRGDNAIGVSVASGGHVELLADGAGQGLTLSTSGLRSHATRVAGGTLLLRGATIDVSGPQSYALFALSGGHIDGDGLTINAQAFGVTGALIASGGGLTLSNSSIEALDEESTGVFGAGAITLRNTDVRVSGVSSTAVSMTGGTLRVEDGVIQADHPQSSTVHLLNGNQVDMIGTRINAGRIGLNIDGLGNDVRLIDVDIHTVGAGGMGVWLLKDSSLAMRGGSIITDATDGVAVDNRAGRVSLDGVHVTTAGAAAHAMSSTFSANAALLEADRTQVLTDGDGAIGALARAGGSTHLRDSTIATTGANSYGVLSGGTGVMTLRATDVTTRGQGAAAAVVNADGSLDIDGGTLMSERAEALWVRAARHVAARNGARLIGGNGALMHVDAAFATPLDLSLDQDVIALGNIAITPADVAAGIPVQADIRVHLNGRSHWRGASSVVNQVTLGDASRWTLTGDSRVGQLTLRDSTLDLSAVGASGFNRLTVDGDVDTDNALLIFNGALAGDASPVDTLHVRGDTRGTAAIQVNNVHGLGAQTVDGIALIQVDGASTAVYQLRGRAVAGQYDYFLHKGGVTTPGDGDWYLRSALATTPDPCEVDPEGPGCVTPPDPCASDPTGPGCIVIPPDPCEADPNGPGCAVPPPTRCSTDPGGPGCVPPPIPCEADTTDTCHRPRPPQVLRPEAGAYLANQAAAVAMFQHRLHDRDGGHANGEARDAGWLRVNRTQTRQDIGGQLALTGRASSVMSGVDVLQWGGASAGRLGLLLATGRTVTEVRSRRSGYTATGTVTGTALGAYASWMQHPGGEDGAYVDGGLHHGRYRTSVQGIGLARERQDARSTAASLETGYAWSLRLGDTATLQVQPQLQLSYTDYRADRVVEHNGTQVAADAAGGLSSRLGMRVTGAVRTEERHVQPFVSAHWLRASGRNRVWLDDSRIEGAVPATRYELRGGAVLQLGTRWSAWGDLGLQRGDNAYRSVSAQMGLNARW
ncbi:autotransporter outer membrane beta-barrel domain-containing protein [Stenotrophomonas nematodicola]|uniref:Autotransporter outer membrane beta-barrel domain-containing protein n=1 Tax=Stenotrophomonas nematodicola TaxID=2656746 RepID=A0ABW7D0P1_9GAMM